MTRLRMPPSLAQLVANTVLGFFGVAVFFGVLYLAALNDSRAQIQDALDAAAARETPLQRAARAVCDDHPHRANRRTEPRWTPDGQLECLVVIAQESTP